MTQQLTRRPRSLREKVRALYEIFGWASLAITLFGLAICVMVGLIPFVARKPILWVEETAMATFAGGLMLVGVLSLRERWLSLAPLEGFTVRPPRPRPVLRWLGIGVSFALGGVLLVGWWMEPSPDERMRWLVPMLGGCCLFVALAGVLMSLRPPLHVLVREGVALRYRRAWSLIPWERIKHIGVGSYYENIVATVELDHLLAPLPTVWRPGVSEEQRQRLLERQLRGFETAERWTRTDVMVWGWSCKMPPGLFALRANECLTNPDARQALPTFEEMASGAC